VELDAGVAGCLGPGELAGVPPDEGFRVGGDVEVFVESGVGLADLGLAVLEQQPVPLTGLSDGVIDIIAKHAYRAGSPRSYAAMFHLGGAVARAPRDATAYPGRYVEHNIIIDAVWLPEQNDTVGAAETAWAREFLAALQPHRAGVYVNFLDSDDDTSRVREAYGDNTYRRLADVKAKYDPENVFHNNKNIQPGKLLVT
jgi:hypothetical protein